eukprot:Skav213759  [mRNA]  locus=scaffold3859:65962:74657:+ [translate_table: standard]
MGASVTVDDVNRIFLLGGRTSPKPPPEGRALNDVWLLDTFKEVNCASSYEGETPCSRQRCEVGPDGSTFTLGSQSFLRYVWRARSASGSDCITTIGGHRRSELGGIISSKSLQCPCPTCTSHPGPPDAPLPSDMINDHRDPNFIIAMAKSVSLTALGGILGASYLSSAFVAPGSTGALRGSTPQSTASSNTDAPSVGTAAATAVATAAVALVATKRQRKTNRACLGCAWRLDMVSVSLVRYIAQNIY